MSRVKCSNCGKPTRYKDGICRSCRTIPTTPVAPAVTPAPGVIGNTTPTVTPTTTPVVVNNGGKKMKIIKTILEVLGVILLIGLIMGSGWLIRGCVYNTIPAATDVIIDDDTDATATETSAFAEDFSLNDPANPSDVNSNIWNQVYDAGVMVGENGDVYYTQSGKDGSVLLHGKIEASQTVVIDAYRLEKDDKIYSEGCILVLNGPVDFDTNPIFYTNGAAQIIATENTQKFLDENVWLKFSRGDRLADDSAWSYKTWALSNIWLPDGITFKELGLTAETDTYPSK